MIELVTLKAPIPFNIDKLTFNLEPVNTNEIDVSQAGFKISPNPTNGVLRVNLSTSWQSPSAQLELFRITGEKIATFKTTGTSTNLNLNNFANGLYLLRLVDDQVNLVHRFLLH